MEELREPKRGWYRSWFYANQITEPCVGPIPPVGPAQVVDDTIANFLWAHLSQRGTFNGTVNAMIRPAHPDERPTRAIDVV